MAPNAFIDCAPAEFIEYIEGASDFTWTTRKLPRSLKFAIRMSVAKKATCMAVELVGTKTLEGTSHNFSFSRHFIVRCLKAKIKTLEKHRAVVREGKSPNHIPSGFDAEFWSTRLNSDFGSALFIVLLFLHSCPILSCQIAATRTGQDVHGSLLRFVDDPWTKEHHERTAQMNGEFRVPAGCQTHQQIIPHSNSIPHEIHKHIPLALLHVAHFASKECGSRCGVFLIRQWAMQRMASFRHFPAKIPCQPIRSQDLIG